MRRMKRKKTCQMPLEWRSMKGHDWYTKYAFSYDYFVASVNSIEMEIEEIGELNWVQYLQYSYSHVRWQTWAKSYIKCLLSTINMTFHCFIRHHLTSITWPWWSPERITTGSPFFTGDAGTRWLSWMFLGQGLDVRWSFTSMTISLSAQPLNLPAHGVWPFLFEYESPSISEIKTNPYTKAFQVPTD